MRIDIDREDLLNLINIKLGLYKPISKLSSEIEYESIINFQKINNNYFPIPFNLYVNKNHNLQSYKKSYLFYQKKPIGILIIKNTFSPNIKKHSNRIFGTNLKGHPGAKLFLEKVKNKNVFLSGNFNIENKKIIKKIFFENFNTVKEIKKIRDKKNYVVFSTRNIIHSGHDFIINKLLKQKKKILIVILLSKKMKFKKKILKNFYKKFVKQRKYFSKIKFNFLEIPTFFAGPKEAAFQSKIFENLGFGYFYVGRDHAGYKDYYSNFSAQNFTKKLRLNIKIIGYNEPMHCISCDNTVFNKFKYKKKCSICKSSRLLGISGTLLRKNIKYSKNLRKLISNENLSFVKKQLLLYYECN